VRAPEPVRQHPNATFVASLAPPAAFIAWLVGLLGLHMTQEAAAGAAIIITSVCLVFAHALRRAGGVVWQIGIMGCCRRIWHGDDQPPVA